MDTVTMIVRHIPRDLRDRFKSVCALKGRTMNEIIVELMRREVERKK